MLAEQIAKTFNAVFGQGEHRMLLDAVNPDNAVFGVHLLGELVGQVLAFLPFLGDAREDCHSVDLVPLQQAASSFTGAL